MSQALLNTLPKPAAPGIPNAAASAGTPGRADVAGQAPASEASFAHTLEQKMKRQGRTSAGEADDAAPQAEPRPAAAEAASAKPAEARASGRSADDGAPEGMAKATTKDGAPATERRSAPATETIGSRHAAVLSAARAAAEQARAAPSDAGGPPSDAPTTAASLAALLPELAARGHALAASGGDEAAAEPGAAQGSDGAPPPAMHALEQLISNILGRMPSAPAPAAETGVPAGADGAAPATVAVTHPASVLAALRGATGTAAAGTAAENGPLEPAAPQDGLVEATAAGRKGATPAAPLTADAPSENPARGAPATAPRAAEAAAVPAAPASTPAAQGALPEGAAPSPTAHAPAAAPEPGLVAGAHASPQGAARSEQAAPPQLPVHTPAGQRAWAEDVGNRVMWMVGRNDAKAELVLTPAHLGKLEVSLQVTGDQTTAHFVAASAAARDALEQAMPRLREILQQAGIQLGQANVSTSGEQRARDEASGRQGRGGRHRAGEIDAVGAAGASSIATTRWREGSGMVDTFA